MSEPRTSSEFPPCNACAKPSDMFLTLRVCSVVCASALEHHAEERMKPIPMLLVCPVCGKRHVDRGAFETKVHHTHSCQFCGTTWRPAIVATVGVQFLPGFKDEDDPTNVYA